LPILLKDFIKIKFVIKWYNIEKQFFTEREKMKKSVDSLVKIMSKREIKEEFIKKLSIVSSNLFKIFNLFIPKKKPPTREICFTLMKELEEVETFLDDYGASQNKDFFYLRELIGSMRWINIALFHCLHISARISNYILQLNAEENEKFIKDLNENMLFYFKWLKKLGKEFLKEAEKLNIKLPDEKFSEIITLPKMQKKILPPDLELSSERSSENQIYNFLIKFLEGADNLNFFVCRKGIFQELTEESFEKFRSSFNQLESIYDTFIKKTEVEEKIKNFKSLRGYIATILHLLEIGKALIHFYERHSDEVRKYTTSIRITQIIDKKKIKESIKNFVLFYSLFFISKGKQICYKIFKSLGTDAEEFIIQTFVLSIPSHRIEDFHIRPIMPITQIANKYKLNTYLYFQRKKYNLKSAIEVAIAIPDIRDVLINEDVEIMIQGPEKAIKEIYTFLKEKCGAQIQTECETFSKNTFIS